MRRPIRAPILVAGIAIVVAMSPVLAASAMPGELIQSTLAATPVVATPNAAAGATATTDFGACIKGGGTADILLLVDESSSLLTSDKGLSRVTSATYFVDQLAGYASAGGLAVDVQLSVFGDSYRTLLGWTGLDRSSMDSVHAGIDSLATRVDGFDTDYWTALNGARNDLAARSAASPDTTRCQAIVWFTDGKLDYSARTDADERTAFGTAKVFAPGIELTSQAAADQVKEAARTDLCRDGGLADQLRSSAVRMFGVLLNGSSSAPSDFDFIESVITGQSAGDGLPCGRLVDPLPGEFHLATDIDSMLFAFDAFASPGNSAIAQSTGICQVAGCSDQTHPFVLDASTPDFRVLATADVGGLDASLRLPDGEIVAFPDKTVGDEATVSAGGAVFTYTWESDKTIAVRVSQGQAPDAVWSGLWQLGFTDLSGTSAGKKSYSNIHISGSLSPALTSGRETEFHTGDVVSGLALGLVNKDGTAVNPNSILGSIAYSAVLVDTAGTSIHLLDSGAATDIGSVSSVDLTDAAIGPAVLTLSLGITTAGFTDAAGEARPGTVLDPTTVALPITILAPLDYPEVASTLDFGQATGAVSLSGRLPVTGDGCVWIPDASAATIEAAPADLGQITVGAAGATTRESCFHGGSGDGLPMTLVTDAAGNGTINGSVPVMIAPTGTSGKPLELRVSFTANLQKPLNATNFWITLITALVLGPGIPLLVLYFAKWLVSKIPARALAGTVITVTVDHGEVLRNGTRFALGPADVRQTIAVDAGGARLLTVNGVELRTKLGWAPGGAGHVTVVAPGQSSASSADRSTDRSGTTAVLPLAVHNHWVLLHTPGAGTAASVLVLIAGDASPAQKNDMANDINRRLPDLLARLVTREGGIDTGSADASMQAGFGSGPSLPVPAPSFTGSFSNAPGSAQASSAPVNPAVSAETGAARPPVPPRFGFSSPPAPDADPDPESGSTPSRWGTR